MVEKTINQELKLKNTDKRRNYFIEEINQNTLLSQKHKKVCTTLYYIEYLPILPSAIAECVSNTAFDSLVCIPILLYSY